MTTRVTVNASGRNYPARMVKTDKDGAEVFNQMISGGGELSLYVAPGQTVTVTEEYHPEGYPLPAEAEAA